MYLIRAVTVHSNRPKEVWFGPSAYTARILWSGGKFFLIEGPQRPPPGLSGLHVVPPTSAQAPSPPRRCALELVLPWATLECDASVPTACVCAIPASRAALTSALRVSW